MDEPGVSTVARAHRHPRPSAEEAVPVFARDQVARAGAYHRPLYAVFAARVALELAVLALIVFSRLGGWLFAPLEGWPWWAQAAAFTALAVAATTLATLPLAVWAGFVRERRFGFSTQSGRGFAADRAKAFALGVGLSAAALVGLVGCARLAPRLWPLLAALAAAALFAALVFLGPLLVEPLFNRFAPVDDPGLAAGLRALAARAGMPLAEVLVADASRRTRKENAYVSGLGRTRRLVVYDTLLARASRPELELVLAHELGHTRARHVLKGVLLGASGACAFVALLWGLLRSEALRDAIGAPAGVADPRAVVFVLLLASVLEVLALPLGSALSRRFERAADRFSLELTRDPACFEAVHRALAEANLADLDPPRAVYLALFSHPTPGERIAAARRFARCDTGGATA